MIIELLIVACLARAPDQCQDFPLVYPAEGASLMSCMMGGQVELVRWKQSHPQWDIARWSCSARREDDLKA